MKEKKKVISKRGEKLPDWVEPVLQGLAYWIGHRRSLYRHYLLTEGALVAETANLIQSHLSSDMRLDCEVQHKNILPSDLLKLPLTSKSRMDLLIGHRLSHTRTIKTMDPTIVIEVKRAKPKAMLYIDLERLCYVKRSMPHLRVFLFVISEAEMPKSFVDANGKALKSNKLICTDEYCYSVRRVCKAAHSFDRKDKAHYCCALEVFPPRDH